MKLISITIPAYNEQDNLPMLYDRLNAVLLTLKDKYVFECIIFDNGSNDQTPRVARELCSRDLRWKYVRYSRNFGSEASLLAGLDFATGDAAINLFSDLQDPPELIPRLLEEFENGYDVVYGTVRMRGDDSHLKTLGAKIAYWLIYHVTECRIPPNATDYRLLSRKVYLCLRDLREYDRYIRGLTHWVGFKKKGVEFDRARREKGQSAANVLYCVYFALNAIISFSSRPLRWVMLFGLAVTFVSVVLAVTYVILYFFPLSFLKTPPPGLMTAVILILMGIGTNSLFLGIIGEYVGRIYNQGKKRPIYIVDETINA